MPERHQHTYDEHGLCFECDKPEPKPTKTRVAAHRARKREAGLVRLELWLTPAERKELKKKLAELRGKS